MYRDDTCAVCDESLPPDHFYCAEHAAGVDQRLHAIGELLARLDDDLPRLAQLLGQIAPETWDYLAERQPGEEPEWPPALRLRLSSHADEVDVDIDTEPGRVRVSVDAGLATLLGAVARGLTDLDAARLAAACRAAEGANATH